MILFQAHWLGTKMRVYFGTNNDLGIQMNPTFMYSSPTSSTMPTWRSKLAHVLPDDLMVPLTSLIMSPHLQHPTQLLASCLLYSGGHQRLCCDVLKISGILLTPFVYAVRALSGLLQSLPAGIFNPPHTPSFIHITAGTFLWVVYISTSFLSTLVPTRASDWYQHII